ncbi:hypothetical protein BJ742DRAFT_832489 [Cladochytrium replicatum]|nr:hypothetical protein BJ742DRAFT_832489 [Cladochytrium replicatum]
MKVLVVGAGAVGQVWAYGLHRGGAEVHFLVRPYQLAQFQRFPMRLHALKSYITFSRNAATKTVTLELPSNHFHAFSSNESIELPESLKAQSFDVILLTVTAASVLAHGNWLAPLGKLLVPETGVLVDPSPRDDNGETVVKAIGIPRDRLVFGDLPLGSWQGPLKGERFEAIPKEAYEVAAFSTLSDGTSVPNPNPVIIYVLFTPQNVSGYPGVGAAVAKDFAAIMTKGGVKCTSGVASEYQPVSIEITSAERALVPAMLIGLEAAGWKFSKVRGEILTLMLAAFKESLELSAKHKGKKPGLLSQILVQSWLWIALLWIVSNLRIVAFDLEPFLEYHFTKVGSQTALFAERYQRIQGEENVKAFTNLVNAHARIKSS